MRIPGANPDFDPLYVVFWVLRTKVMLVAFDRADIINPG